MLIEWVAMSVSMVGAVMFSFEKIKYAITLYLIASCMWFIVAYIHGITALMVLNAFYILFESIGTYKMWKFKKEKKHE